MSHRLSGALVVVVLLLAGCTATAEETAAGSATAGDSLFSLAGNGGYDVDHYTLDLDVDPVGNSLDATATIEATANEALSAFNLDFHGLTVESVTVDGDEATFSRDGDELTITPDRALEGEASFTATIRYSGTPTAIPLAGVPDDLGWHHFDGGIYTVSEPIGAKTWFPNNNHPLDKATYTIRITAPSAFTSAATGLLVEETTAGDSTTTVWEMNQPMASYLSAIYVGDYVREESEGPDGLLIRDYFPPTLTAEEKEAFQIAPLAIDFYSDLFGPYPFDVYGSIVVDDNLEYALENQTLSIHGRATSDPYTIAHEVMHQWTGNDVSPGDWQDVWLNEGFAFFIPFLFLESIDALELDPLMQMFYAEIETADSVGPATVNADQLFDETSVYQRGGLTLYALYEQFGEETFRSIMKTYYEQHQGGTATTADFVAVAKSIAGDEAEALLNSWLLEGPLPALPSAENPDETTTEGATNPEIEAIATAVETDAETIAADFATEAEAAGFTGSLNLAVTAETTPNLIFASADGITVPLWETLDDNQRGLFETWAAASDGAFTAKTFFDRTFNWFFVPHEAGHILNFATGNATEDLYGGEVQANEIAIAYWKLNHREELDEYIEIVKALVGVLEAPEETTPEYFNANYEALGTDPAAYGYFQFSWILEAYENVETLDLADYTVAS